MLKKAKGIESDIGLLKRIFLLRAKLKKIIIKLNHHLTQLLLRFFFSFSFSRNAGAISAQTLQKNLQSMKLSQPSGSRSMRV